MTKSAEPRVPLRSEAGPSRPPRATALRSTPSDVPELVGKVPFAEAKRRFVMLYLTELLEACSWNVTKAAYFAKVERSNFKRLMKQHGVKRPTTPEWNGLCPANQHGLDYYGQPCDHCVHAEYVRAAPLEGLGLLPLKRAQDRLRDRAPRMEHVQRKGERREPEETHGPARIELPPGVDIHNVVFSARPATPADAFLNTTGLIDDDD